MNWFLYDRDIRYEGVNNSYLKYFLVILLSWFYSGYDIFGDNSFIFNIFEAKINDTEIQF